MRFYHTTTEEAADAILASGFRDATDSYMFVDTERTGVFLANRPVDGNEGTRGDVVLLVDMDITVDELEEYAIVEDGHPVWEYIFPAATVNERARVSRSLPADDSLDVIEFTFTDAPDEP